jgi:SAM-dependent MidA family methyltransferase
VLSYSSQAAFLLDSGITTLLQRTDPCDADRYLPQTNALQRLLSPAEMGELFKVIILGRDFELPLCYAHNNRSHRL